MLSIWFRTLKSPPARTEVKLASRLAKSIDLPACWSVPVAATTEVATITGRSRSRICRLARLTAKRPPTIATPPTMIGLERNARADVAKV